MNRLEQLLSKFPEIPRSIVLKTELIRHGIRFTPVLREVGEWALPQTLSVYVLDHEYSYTKEDSTTGWISVPYFYSLADETLMSVIFDSKSPYEIRGETGKYMVYLDETPIEEVFFPPRPKWYSKRTSNGTLMANVGFQMGDMFTAMCINHCAYFKNDDQCAFCSMNPTTDYVKTLGIERTVGRTVADFVETCIEASKETSHMTLSGGALLDRRKEALQYIKLYEGLRDAGFQHPCSSIDPQALEEEDARKLHELGVQVIGYNMEVWQEHLWPIINPGKTKHVGREKWIDCLLKAVEIYGRGNVFSVFVGGMEMVSPHGFTDMDEAINSTLGGFEWLVQRGIIPKHNIWFSSPGSKLANAAAPPSEYYLKVGLGLHKLQTKYDLHVPRNFCHKCEYLRLLSDFPRLMPAG